MTDASHNWLSILADGDGGLWELVPLLIFVVISIIGSIIKKAATDREEKQRQQENADRARQDRLRTRQTQAARQPQARQQQAQKPRPATREERKPARRTGVPPIQPPPRRIPPRRQPQPQRMTPEQTARAQEQRLERDSQQRSRRLAARKSPESDSRAIGDRLVSVHPSIGLPVEETPEEEASFRIALDEPEKLRSAIIYYEVFSPPKALRTQPEVWET